MIADELSRRIHDAFGFIPTSEQEDAITVCVRFLSSYEERGVMVLRGCAGTGKTLLASAIVRTLSALDQPVVLLAPTGRAAKVFALNSGQKAFTIHRFIYRQQIVSAEMSGFSLGFNGARRCLFIVDEASMLSDSYGGDNFGSGHLLDDLIRFVYSGSGCRLMFIGDDAQLPPIGETFSPALDASVLEGYGLSVYEATLNEVLRQSKLSGILWNASQIRALFGRDLQSLFPQVRFNGFADIHNVRGDELTDFLADSIRRVGMDETIVITRSNFRANIINNGIRRMVFDREDELEGGDIVMIVRNNYFWFKNRERENKSGGDIVRGVKGGTGKFNLAALEEGKEAIRKENEKIVRTDSDDGVELDAPDFIANGDRAIIRRLHRHRELYGFRFADAVLCFPDYNNIEVDATVLLDVLHTKSPSLDEEDWRRLYESIEEDYQHVSTKRERIQAIREDVYFNALQLKYAYAVTCHKAQGGEWSHVYVDGCLREGERMNEEYIHWLYTAFTRASEHLFLINWPEKE